MLDIISFGTAAAFEELIGNRPAIVIEKLSILSLSLCFGPGMSDPNEWYLRRNGNSCTSKIPKSVPVSFSYCLWAKFSVHFLPTFS
jgi:hypothetical protein